MEELLDAVDALARVDRPELFDALTVPEEVSPRLDPFVYMELKDTTKGKGWFATQNLPAGTRLLVAKPIAAVLHWEDEPPESNDPEDEMESGDDDDDDDENDDDDDDEALFSGPDPEPRINELLLVDLLEELLDNKELWFNTLTQLFPRTNEELAALPAWVCPDDAMFMEVESLLEQLKLVLPAETVSEISKRLPHIVRYNILSMETCSELLSYPGPDGHSSLAGVALYHYPSFFNHSSRPNVNRWALGDLMFFVTNQAVTAGQELCISYLEHDVLCESPYRRNSMLRMDFQDGGEEYSQRRQVDVEEQEGPDMPVVDTDVQNELMGMNPLERIDAIDELLQQALGEKGPSSETMELSDRPGWFQCDVHNLRILKAITLDAMGQSVKALELWEQAVLFTETSLPPADESGIMIRTQAALSALQTGDWHRAKEHAEIALRTHDLVFGGGVRFFQRRYRHDFALKLRPAPSGAAAELVQGKAPFELLWPLEAS
jgi:hypothetical protein